MSAWMAALCGAAVSLAGVVLAWLWRRNAGRAVEARPQADEVKDERTGPVVVPVEAAGAREAAARAVEAVELMRDDELDLELAEYERRTAAARGDGSKL